MAKRIPRWVLVSCSGCVVVILVAAGLMVGGVFVFRDALRSFEEADQTLETVAAKYGPIPAFRPSLDGAIPPGRMDAFLTVRETMAPVREGLGQTLGVLSGASGGTDASTGSFGKLTASFYLLHRLADFVDEQNRALLEAEMGHGEYYYLYTLAYYSWLRKPLDDGPSFKLVNEHGYVFDTVASMDEAAVREYRIEQARGSLNRLLLSVQRNQLSDLTVGEVDDDHQPWVKRLSEEIAAMEADSRRLPWEDGLPEVIAASFEPYRGRLEENYSDMCNALEVGLARR